MSQVIDLGNDSVYMVQVNGTSYEVREPKIKDARAFQKAQKKKGDDEMGVFIDFLDGLGLPREVSENLALSKIKTLTDRLIGDLEKK